MRLQPLIKYHEEQVNNNKIPIDLCMHNYSFSDLQINTKTQFLGFFTFVLVFILKVHEI